MVTIWPTFGCRAGPVVQWRRHGDPPAAERRTARRAPCSDAGSVLRRPGGWPRPCCTCSTRPSWPATPSSRPGWRPTSRPGRSAWWWVAASAAGPSYRLEHLPPVQRGLLVSNVEAAGHADPAGARHGRQPLDLHPAAPGPDAAAGSPGLRDELLPVDQRRAHRGRGPVARRSSGSSRRPATSGSTSSGHSLGGLIARYYVTRLGGDERVHTLVTLGHAAQRQLPRVRRADPADAAAAPRQRADARAGAAGARTAGPGSWLYWSDHD